LFMSGRLSFRDVAIFLWEPLVPSVVRKPFPVSLRSLLFCLERAWVTNETDEGPARSVHGAGPDQTELCKQGVSVRMPPTEN
jgi:hypothetical protein